MLWTEEIKFNTGNKELDFVVNKFAGKAYIKLLSKPVLGRATFIDTSNRLAYLFEEYKKTSEDGSPSLEYNILDYIPLEAINNLETQVNEFLTQYTDKNKQLKIKMTILRRGLNRLTLKENASGLTILDEDEEKQRSKFKSIIKKMEDAGLNQLTKDSDGKDTYSLLDKLYTIESKMNDSYYNLGEYVKYIKELKNNAERISKLFEYSDKLPLEEFRMLLWLLSVSKHKKHIYAIQSLQVDSDTIFELSIGVKFDKSKKTDNQFILLKKLYRLIYDLDKTTAEQTNYVLFNDPLLLTEKPSKRALKHFLEINNLLF